MAKGNFDYVIDLLEHEQGIQGHDEYDDEIGAAINLLRAHNHHRLHDRETVKHLKRGTHYSVMPMLGMVQCDMPLKDNDVVTVYQRSDGVIYVRPPSEFWDGRFIRLADKE
jgi:hypothetical protein